MVSILECCKSSVQYRLVCSSSRRKISACFLTFQHWTLPFEILTFRHNKFSPASSWRIIEPTITLLLSFLPPRATYSSRTQPTITFLSTHDEAPANLCLLTHLSSPHRPAHLAQSSLIRTHVPHTFLSNGQNESHEASRQHPRAPPVW